MTRLSKSLFWNLSALLLLMFSWSCKEDNPANVEEPGPGEQELITTINVTLTPQGGGAAVTAQFKDLDGDGGNAPTISTLNLKAGVTYNGTIELLNETENPAGDITEEVMGEAEAHQFFFEARGGIVGRVTITYADKESDYVTNTGTDHPVGLKFTVIVTAGADVSGEFNIVLSHYDAEPKNGTDRSSETDVDVAFPVNITQ